MDVSPIATFRGHEKPLTSLAVSASGEHIYTSSVDTTIRAWRVPDINTSPYDPYDSLQARMFVGHTDIVWDVLAHPVEQTLVSCSADETIKVWNSQTGDVTHTFSEEIVAPTMICWSTDYKYVCVGSTSGSIRFFNLDTHSLVRSLHVSGRVTDVAIDPESGLLAVACDDRNICLFDSRSSDTKEVQRLTAHTDAVTCLAFGTGSSLVSSGMWVGAYGVGIDCSVRWWDLKSDRCVQEVSGHRKSGDAGVWGVGWNRDCSLVASGGADGVVKVYGK